jgi:acyl dehydratase
VTLGPDLPGAPLGAKTSAWSAGDAILYALGIGAGQADPGRELAFTTDNTAAAPQQVYPTFALLPGADHGVRAALELLGDDVDVRKMLHVGQSCEQLAPLPTAGSVVTTGTVAAIWDKEKATVVETETEVADAATGDALARCRQTLMFRGVGGWGGERGPSAPRPAARPEPDRVLSATTRPDQPLLYRLCGDDNPLHTDPAVARAAGFERPIMHGLCTFGIVGRLLLSAYCDGEVARFGALAGRFSAPAMPGETIDVNVWKGERGLEFTATNQDGKVVLDGGEFTVREPGTGASTTKEEQG